MNERRRVAIRLQTTVLVWTALVATGVVSAQLTPGQQLSVQEFVQRKADWPNLVGRLLRIQGRYSLWGKNVLRFQNCDLIFRSENELPKPSAGTQNVEAVGRLAFDGKKLYFAVEHLLELPSDEQRFELQKQRLDPQDPQQWYRLGQWAEQQAEFYQDEQLRAKAHEAYTRAVELERRQARRDGPLALFRLADKAAGLGLPRSLSLSLTHEGCYLLWQQAGKKPDKLQQATEEIRRRLPDADTPLPSVPEETRAKYLASPVSFYNSADNQTRRILHRILFCEVATEAILATAAEDGRNGLNIAARLEQVVPERADLAEQYRQRGRAYRLAHAEELARTEAVELATWLRKQGQPERANEVLRRWLAAREKILRQEGPDGLRQLALEYESLLKDSNKTFELLVQAYRLSGGEERFAQELRSRGYRLAGNRWLPLEEFLKTPEGKISLAMQEGRVVEGMTPIQVRKTLGKPTSVWRALTKNSQTEVWVYKGRSADLSVVFVRSRYHPQLKVQRVYQLPQ